MKYTDKRRQNGIYNMHIFIYIIYVWFGQAFIILSTKSLPGKSIHLHPKNFKILDLETL